MTIGDRIKEVRKALNYTQQRFADELGLKQNTVATYEMNKTVPSERTMMDIQEKFRVNITWLKTGEGEMFNSVSKEIEIMRFVQKITHKNESELDQFRLNLISALAKLDESEWETLAKIVDKLANGK